ncbi:hypothetical protein [Mesorhizobium sp. M0678]|uniref:hypothetical protein n=1 Tax=Mesorhizobium sp. M0678 TaxID=2956985 RepID=UPI0033366F5E
MLVAQATMEKPIVSGIDGIAVGIGTTLNLHCDRTFATRRTPFVDLSLVADAGTQKPLPWLMRRTNSRVITSDPLGPAHGSAGPGTHEQLNDAPISPAGEMAISMLQSSRRIRKR